MRVRLNRLRLTSLVLPFAIVALSANATSLGKSAAPSAAACALAAKFVEAKLVGGKIFWAFERVGTAPASGRCAKLGRTFDVFIPSGSFSKLSHSNVYPISITEPPPGSEVDLRVEPITFTTGGERWLISGDADAFRVRR